MKRRTILASMGAATAGGSLVIGSGGFSSAEVERGVSVAIVGDEDAYLGLSEDDIEEDGVLFGAEMPRVTPEEFDIINQTPSSIAITVQLLDGALEFKNEGETVESPGTDVTLQDGQLEIGEVNSESTVTGGLEPGGMVEGVTLGIPGPVSVGTVADTLRFTVEGAGLYIQADRTLELEPLNLDLSWPNVNASLRNKSGISIDFDSVLIDGVYGVSQNGNSPTASVDRMSPSDVGCSESNNRVSVTVTGRTSGGKAFVTKINSVGCAAESDKDDKDD